MIESMERTRHPQVVGEGEEMTAQKLMGVAVLGALGSLAMYYIYCTLGSDTRQAIRDNISNTLKTNLQKLIQ